MNERTNEWVNGRRVAEVFGRVLVLTGIFIKGVVKYERRRREPLGGSGGIQNFEIYSPGNAIFSIVHVNI